MSQKSSIRIVGLQYPNQPEDSHNTPEYPILGSVDKILVEEFNLDEAEAIYSLETYRPSSYRIIDAERKFLFLAKKSDSKTTAFQFVDSFERSLFEVKYSPSGRLSNEVVELFNVKNEKKASILKIPDNTFTIRDEDEHSVLRVVQEKWIPEKFKILTSSNGAEIGSLSKHVKDKPNSKFKDDGYFEIIFPTNLQIIYKVIIIGICIYLYALSNSMKRSPWDIMNNRVGTINKSKYRKSRAQSKKAIIPAQAILDNCEKVFLEEVLDNDSEDGETAHKESGEALVDPNAYRIFDSEGKTLLNAEKSTSEGLQVTFLLTNQRKQLTFEMTFSLNRNHSEPLVLYTAKKQKIASLSRIGGHLTIKNFQDISIMTLDEPGEESNFDTDEFKVKTVGKQEVVGSLKKLEPEANSTLPEGVLVICFQKDLDTTIKAIIICACIYFHHSIYSKTNLKRLTRCHLWLTQTLRSSLSALKCS